MESNNSKIIPYAIIKKREDDKRSCLDLLSHMKNFIPKTINDTNNINSPTDLIEKTKSFNTECPEFLQYINEINNGNTGAQIKVLSYNVSYVHRSIDWRNEKINYYLRSTRYG